MYLCCSEAIQNVVKHAGPSAQVKLGLHHSHGVLDVRVEDDGRGFDPEQTPDGAGLETSASVSKRSGHSRDHFHTRTRHRPDPRCLAAEAANHHSTRPKPPAEGGSGRACSC